MLGKCGSPPGGSVLWRTYLGQDKTTGGRNHLLIIYYSSDGSRANPEISIGDDATIMLSQYYMQKGPDPRFSRILKEIDTPNRKPNKGSHPRELEGIEKLGDVPVGVPLSHFYDSGSFSLWTRAEKYAKEHNCGEWEFYDTDDFWDYFENYAEFVKTYSRGIHHHSNIDVLPFRRRTKPPKGKSSHKLTWRNQVELEKRGLNPIPVIHYKAPMSVLKHYLAAGYDYISLGGIVGSVMLDSCKGWIDRSFDIICDTKDRLPAVKVHGFGATGWNMITKYPWHSVDSTSWTKAGGFGNLMVPHKRDGKFVFDRPPYTIAVSFESPEIKWKGRHLTNMNKGERKIVEEWLEFIDVPLGEFHYDEDRNPVKDSNGVLTEHINRRYANLLLFQEMKKSISIKPFQNTRSDGFGFFQ